MTDVQNKKPGVAFWATVAVVVALVAYPLSFGPATALVDRELLRPSIATTVYLPCVYLSVQGPPFVQEGFWFWARLCRGNDEGLRRMIMEYFDWCNSIGSA
jgi:hypothetical protein